MRIPLTVQFSPNWDFETFLYKNYGSSHTKEQRGKALSQYFYCVKHYEVNEYEIKAERDASNFDYGMNETHDNY